MKLEASNVGPSQCQVQAKASQHTPKLFYATFGWTSFIPCAAKLCKTRRPNVTWHRWPISRTSKLNVTWENWNVLHMVSSSAVELYNIASKAHVNLAFGLRVAGGQLARLAASKPKAKFLDGAMPGKV